MPVFLTDFGNPGFQNGLRRAMARVKRPEGAAHGLHFLRTNTGTLQADPVQSDQTGAIPQNASVRNDVHFHTADTADNGTTADPDELVQRSRAHDFGVIVNLDMATHDDIVDDDDTVTEDAVMGDM